MFLKFIIYLFFYLNNLLIFFSTILFVYFMSAANEFPFSGQYHSIIVFGLCGCRFIERNLQRKHYYVHSR